MNIYIHFSRGNLSLLFILFLMNLNAQVFDGFEVHRANPGNETLPMGVRQYSVHPENDSIIFALLGNNHSGLTTDGGNSWLIRENQPGSHVAFYSSDSLLKVDGQEIQLSTDLGQTWQTIHTHTSNLLTIYPISHGYIYIGGTAGTILVSKDAGNSWQVMFNETFGYPDVANFYAIDTANVFAMGGTGGTAARRLRRTENCFQSDVNITPSGSLNFQDLSVQNRGFMHFFDNDLVIMGFGYRMWRSQDGGVTWTSPTNFPVSNATNGHYNNYLVTNDSIFLIRRNVINLSTNNMTTFTQLHSGIINSGQQGSGATSSSVISRNRNILFTYSNGLIYNYAVDNNTFQHLSNPIQVHIGGSNMGIAMINYYDLNNGVVSGPFYELGNHLDQSTWNSYATSQDGGFTYDFFTHSSNVDVTPVLDYSFIDNLNGYVLRAQTPTSLNPAYKTADGGLTWSTQPTSVDGDPNFLFLGNGAALHALDINILYMVRGSFLYKTVDQGVNWTILNNSLPNLVNGIHFWNEINGIITSPSGTLITNDGGTTWTSVHSGIARSVTGFGTNSAIIGGTLFAMVTHDFGQTFTELPTSSTFGLNFDFWGGHMANDNEGVLASRSRALITFDGWSSHYVVDLPNETGASYACQMLADSTVVVGAGNVLMKIIPKYTIPELSIENLSGNAICEFNTLDFLVNEDGFLNSPEFLNVYVYNSQDTIISDLNVPSSFPQNFSYSLIGTPLSETDTNYIVEISATNTNIANEFNIVLYPVAQTPVIEYINDTLFTNPPLVVEWLLDGNYIAGSNGNFYVPSDNGTYTAIYNPFGICESAISNAVDLNNLGISILTTSEIRVYPNPSSGTIHLAIPDELGVPNRIELFDNQGRLVTSLSDKALLTKQLITLNNLSPGSYMVQISFNSVSHQSQIIVGY